MYHVKWPFVLVNDCILDTAPFDKIASFEKHKADLDTNCLIRTEQVYPKQYSGPFDSGIPASSYRNRGGYVATS